MKTSYHHDHRLSRLKAEALDKAQLDTALGKLRQVAISHFAIGGQTLFHWLQPHNGTRISRCAGKCAWAVGKRANSAAPRQKH